MIQISIQTHKSQEMCSFQDLLPGQAFRIPGISHLRYLKLTSISALIFSENRITTFNCVPEHEVIPVESSISFGPDQLLS